jgi:amino acid transporter
LFYSILVFLLAVFSNFITLAAVSVVSRLIYYITTGSALLVFRAKRGRAPFTLPLGPAIPLFGIVFALFLLQYPKPEEVYFTLGGILVGTVLYFFVKRNESRQS